VPAEGFPGDGRQATILVAVGERKQRRLLRRHVQSEDVREEPVRLDEGHVIQDGPDAVALARGPDVDELLGDATQLLQGVPAAVLQRREPPADLRVVRDRIEGQHLTFRHPPRLPELARA